MKILITTEFYLPFVCGITTAVVNERKALSALGHDVRVLTINSDKESYYSDGVYYIRQNVPQLYKDSYASLALHDELVEEVIKWQPDIVHAQNEFFSFLFAKRIARKLSLPLILTCHTDYPSYGYNFIKSKTIWDAICKQFIPKIISPCNALLCSTDKIYDLIKSYEPKVPVLKVRLGIDLERYEQLLSEDEKKKIYQQYKLDSSKFTYISVCRLSKEKQVDKCIEAFKIIHDRNPETQFLIVGIGNEMEALIKLVQSYDLVNSVIFAGEIPSDEVWKFYKISDCFINASESETQGLTFIEALASGIPVICRNNPVNSSFLRIDENGYSYNNLEEMVNLCNKLLDDEKLVNRLKAHARKSVESYSLSTFGNKLEVLFDLAIQEKWKIGTEIPDDSNAIEKFGEQDE